MSSDVTVLGNGEVAPSGCSVAIVDDSTTIYVLLTGVLDPVLEVQKLQKKVRMESEEWDDACMLSLIQLGIYLTITGGNCWGILLLER